MSQKKALGESLFLHPLNSIWLHERYIRDPINKNVTYRIQESVWLKIRVSGYDLSKRYVRDRLEQITKGNNV